MRLDRQHTDLSRADFGAGSGVARVVGDLTLNYEKVSLHAEIDLATLKGDGFLEYLGPAEAWRKQG